MGEMADLILDDLITYNHEYEYDIGKTCKYCGKGGFIWKQVDGRWRLFKGGKVHDCSKQPSKLMEDYEI